MSRFMSGSPSVERTFSLPSNSIPPGSFLLPSYPLTPVTGSLLAPTLPRRNHTESSLSASNTWPNKREISPRLRRDVTGQNMFSAALLFFDCVVFMNPDDC